MASSNGDSSSSSSFPPPPPPPASSTSSSAAAAAAIASSSSSSGSSLTTMAAASSTTSAVGSGGVIVSSSPAAHHHHHQHHQYGAVHSPPSQHPHPLASSPGPHTPTSTPSSSSSNSTAQQAVAGPSSASAAPLTHHRNKRQELSFAERIQVILARKSGKSMRQLAVQFGCGKTQILNILGQREAYLREWDEKQAESNPHISSRKRRSRRTGNEETNRLVWEWYTAQRDQGIRVTGPMLQREARSIARGLGISNFAASNGWLDSFRRLHNIGPQSRALQQQQQQSRLAGQQQQQQQQQSSSSSSLYSPFGTNGGGGQQQQHQQQQQQHDPSIPTISASYSIDPESFGQRHATEAISPAASSSAGSCSSHHLTTHAAAHLLPPPPPLEAFGSDMAPYHHHQQHHHHHQHPEFYVEEDEDDDAGDYYRRQEHQQQQQQQQQQQHDEYSSPSSASAGRMATATSTVSLDEDDGRSVMMMSAARAQHNLPLAMGSESSAFTPYRPLSSPSCSFVVMVQDERGGCWTEPAAGARQRHYDDQNQQFTELYPMQQQQATPVQHAQQVCSPRQSVQQQQHHHDDRPSTLLTIGQPVVHHQHQHQHHHQVQQPVVRRSVLVSTRAAAAALESQLHEANQVGNQHHQHDAIVAGPSSSELALEEKRRLFAVAVSSSESSSSGLEPLSGAASGTFAQLTSAARQRNLAYFQYTDDHGESWLEMRPPATSAFRVPLYGYRTQLLRVLVDRQLSYWVEAIGHCVRTGSLRLANSATASDVDANQLDQLLELLAGGAVVCQGRGSVLKRVHQFHPKAAVEQGIAGNNYFTLPDYRYRSYDCARLVDARAGTAQCAACLRPPEPPPPPLEVISPPSAAARFSPLDVQFCDREASQHDSRMDTGRDDEKKDDDGGGGGNGQRAGDHEPLNLSVHPPVMGVLRFPSPGGFSSFPPFESGAEPNQVDYRLAEEAAYLSLHPREKTVSAAWASAPAGNGADYQRRARSDSPVRHHLEAATIGSKSVSPAFDPEFHTTWVKQETHDSPPSNGS